MSEYLDEVFGGIETTHTVIYRLNDLADALYCTGNDQLAEKMAEMATLLTGASDQIRKAVAKEANRGLEQAQRASAGIIETCLATSSLHEKSRPASPSASVASDESE